MKIVLTGAPQSTNMLYRHTCVKGAPVVYMTREGKALKEQYQWEARSQWRRPVFEGSIGLDISLYFPDKRKHDIDNFFKILFDALTGIVYADDSQINEMEVKKFVDGKKPRIEILIK